MFHPDSQTSTNQYNSYGYYTWIGQLIDSSGTIGEYASDRTLGTKASTTGNATGVYDMSGGSSEYVMGNYNSAVGSSGFTTFPSTKYYDVYSADIFTASYSTNMSLCTLETCGGHALSETTSWYSDDARFVVGGLPWFRRGGNYVSGSGGGVFNSYSNNGKDNGNFSWRCVLLADNGA